MWGKHRKLVRDALLKVETDCKRSLFSVFHPFIALKCFQMGVNFNLDLTRKSNVNWVFIVPFMMPLICGAVLKKPVFQAGISSIFVWGNWAENRLKSFQLVVCNLRVCKCFSFTSPKKCEPTRECNKDVNQAQSSEGVWLGKGSENDA